MMCARVSTVVEIRLMCSLGLTTYFTNDVVARLFHNINLLVYPVVQLYRFWAESEAPGLMQMRGCSTT